MNLGVDVRVQDRLHAKVLIIDDKHAFLGSQNFTNFSTGSIEITAQVDREDEVDDFFEYFSNLHFDSRSVTVSELNQSAGYKRYS